MVKGTEEKGEVDALQAEPAGGKTTDHDSRNK